MSASATDTDEPAVSHAVKARMAVPVQGRAAGHHRRAVREARRRERWERRLYGLAGLAVIAALLAVTIVVVDMVR